MPAISPFKVSLLKGVIFSESCTHTSRAISSLRNENLGVNPHSPFLNCTFLEGRDDGPYAVIRAVHKYFQVFLFWTWDSITLSHAFDVSHNQMICFGQCDIRKHDTTDIWKRLTGVCVLFLLGSYEQVQT